MRKIVIFIMIGFSILLFANILAITENGEKVILHKDGTWEYLSPATDTSWWDYVDYISCYYDHGELNKYYDVVGFQFVFKNLADKEITGIEFEVKFLDAFSDEVFSIEIKDNLRIKPKEIHEPLTYWYFEEYSNGYEKLHNPVINETLHTLLNVLRIAFDDGKVIKFEEKFWKEPKEGDVRKYIDF